MFTKIGLDFSLNFPALTINSNNMLNYYSFYRPEEIVKFTKRQNQMLAMLVDISNFHMNVLPNKVEIKPTKYSLNEMNKSLDANTVSKMILDIILNEDNPKVSIEGFSYNSKGSSQLELAGYQYIIRHNLIKNNIEFNIFSPKTIKKYAGKGDFNKNEMALSYLHNSLNDEMLSNCPVRQLILDNIDLFFLNGKSNKVWEDIVDSYFIMKIWENEK